MADAKRPQMTRVVIPASGAGLAKGTHPIININSRSENPMTFFSARVCKSGGTDHDTDVILRLDGNIVLQENFKALIGLGLKQAADNYSATVYEGKINNKDIQTITISFPAPLSFSNDLVIEANIKEDGVQKMEGTVYWGTDDIIVHAGPGDPDPPLFP